MIFRVALLRLFANLVCLCDCFSIAFLNVFFFVVVPVNSMDGEGSVEVLENWMLYEICCGISIQYCVFTLARAADDQKRVFCCKK